MKLVLVLELFTCISFYSVIYFSYFKELCFIFNHGQKCYIFLESIDQLIKLDIAPI